MFTKLEILNSNAHRNLHVLPISNFKFAASIHVASIMVHEFNRATATYPIVFVEDEEQDAFMPVVLLGLEPGRNLFVDADGRWNATYVPAIIRRYPFSLAQSGDEKFFNVCIDTGSDLINETEGQRLFDDEGQAAPVIERIKSYLTELQSLAAFTQEFCAELKSMNMFSPLNMKVMDGGRIRNISGAYVVNAERLNNLSDKKFLELRQKRYLTPIYSHLTSLAQIERLVQLRDGLSATIPDVADAADVEPAPKAAE